jgi:hypothetical protein
MKNHLDPCRNPEYISMYTKYDDKCDTGTYDEQESKHELGRGELLGTGMSFSIWILYR